MKTKGRSRPALAFLIRLFRFTLMQSMKNALAVIGIIAIAAVARFIAIHSFDKDGTSEISDAASCVDIKQHIRNMPFITTQSSWNPTPKHTII